MVEPLALPAKKVVLIVVNDAEAAGYRSKGRHWSLMVLIPSNSTFYHLDSLDLNYAPAKALATKVIWLMCIFPQSS